MPKCLFNLAQRVEASQQIYKRKFLNDAGLPSIEHQRYAQQLGTDMALMIDLQCEINEAVRLIQESIADDNHDATSAPEEFAWLERNK